MLPIVIALPNIKHWSMREKLMVGIILKRRSTGKHRSPSIQPASQPDTHPSIHPYSQTCK